MTHPHRKCPACRLPRKPIIVLDEIVDGHFCVIALCEACRTRLKTCPHHSIKRALHRAAVTGATDPAAYWFAAFTDRSAAQLTLALLQHHGMYSDTARSIGWQLDPE